MIRPKYLIMAADLLLAYCALLTAYLIRFFTVESLQDVSYGGPLRLLLYLAVIFFSSYFFELYEKQHFSNKRFLAYRIPAAAVLSFLILSAVFYLFPHSQFGRGVLL